MLDAHRKEIMPQITSVIETQKKIELNNNSGDSLIGYADLLGTWKDIEGPIVIDYKTSSMRYADDSVTTSPQLSIYAHALGYKKAGYVVFSKHIKKNKTKECSICKFDGTSSKARSCNNEINGVRCGEAWNETIRPSVDIQVLINEIPERTDEIVLDNVQMINKAIKSGVFVRNFNSCKTGYGICPYYNLCYKNKSDGLEKG